MRQNYKNILLHNILISCGYGISCIFFKIFEFRELFGDKKVFSSFSIADYLFHFALLKAALWYSISFFSVYILAATLCWFMAIDLTIHTGCRKRTGKLFCYLYLIGFLYLASISNTILYPNTGTLRLNILHFVIAGVMIVVFFLPFLFLFVRLFKRLIALELRWFFKYTGIFSTIILLLFIAYSMVLSKGSETRENTQPNIIIIGIDSLVPTLTSINKNDNKNFSATPNIDRFLEGATVFENAWTPFARTYPAWISLLTGTYPIKNGARYNLIDTEFLNKDNIYLTNFLKEQGYQTVYGSDEKRFCNIDQSYGFDTLIGPKMGAADFLLAPILDTPLTNLLINTRLGKFLFPYNHSNRAIHATYRPDTFIKNVKHTISSLSDKPVFLALHLCLPHWPYTWAKKETLVNNDPYLASVIRADIQFGNLFHVLKNHLLDNALIFVVSDHGESEGPSDEGQSAFTSATGDEPLITRMPGHGTYVIDKIQYRIVFGVKGFGKVRNMYRVSAQPVSLIDIFPTILEIMGSTINHQPFDGISLEPWITNQKNPPVKDRCLFVESGYNPAPLMDVKNISLKGGDLGKIVATGIGSYRIKGNGRIVLKKELLKELFLKKQYAVFNKDRAVALIPGENGIRRMVGINYEKKTWTQLIPNTQDDGVYTKLLYKLNEKYIKE